MDIDVISTEELGDRSYVVSSGGHAVVIDPQRDLDRVEAILDSKKLVCGLVLETHIHNDYVTGGLELARRRGCPYVVSADDDVKFERVGARDGDEMAAGPLTVRVVSTPGHTDTHLSYVVRDSDDPAVPPAVFTGGSLLYGSVGRTDLVDPARTEELTRAQFFSARRLASELPDETGVYPTHGFGSFCSSGSAAGGDGGTIAGEKERNDALTTDDEDAFVATLIANLTAYPSYYAHMGPLNRNGPDAADLSTPAPASPEQLRERIEAGEWVVDLRDRTIYASGHLQGSIGIPGGGQFSTYVGWLMPWGNGLTLVGHDADQIATAQRDLARIGIEDLRGQATGDAQDLNEGSGVPLGNYPRLRFADLPQDMIAQIKDESPASKPAPDRVVLDVRRDDERAQGGVNSSVHVPLHSLLHRMDELPDAQLWVHCASGFRASIAASLLSRAGKDVVYLDDSYDNAVEAGLTTTNPSAPSSAQKQEESA